MLIKTFGFAEGSSPDLARPEKFRADLVRIELRVERGILFRISGMGASAAKAAQARIRSALLSCGFKWPGKGITINVSPASISRNSSNYDLAIALCILAAEGKVPTNKIEELIISGELGLDGAVYSRNVETLTSASSRDNPHLRNGLSFSSLKSVIAHLNSNSRSVKSSRNHTQNRGTTSLDKLISHNGSTEAKFRANSDTFMETTFSQISGEPSAKRKAIIAAAGDHNIVLIGPPGSGKSVLAKCIHSLMPQLEHSQAKEVTRIYKRASMPCPAPTVPWRAPHNSSGPAGLIGAYRTAKGANAITIGEWSLAHHGVLFLDEWPEFSRNALEACRLPMETGHIALARAAGSLELPARALLIAALNPCPCGRLTDPGHQCFCTPSETRGYLKKLSGPVADRFGLHVELGHERDVKYESNEIIDGFRSVLDDFSRKNSIISRKNDNSPTFDSETLFWEHAKKTVKRVRDWRRAKFGLKLHPHLPSDLLRYMDNGAMEWLDEFSKMSGITSRGKFMLLDVALTTSLIDGSEIISIGSIAEAAESRLFDRSSWLSGAKDPSIPAYLTDVRSNLPAWINNVP